MKISPNISRRKLQLNLRRRLLAIAIAAAVPMTAMSTISVADEFGINTRTYEDDAWYDVSEWFDGNDYNPTDEAIGRIDDESYDSTDALTSTDADNDIDWSTSSYGYYDGNDNDWYYDYSNYGYTDYADYNHDGYYDYTADYYDYDYDGIYDATSEYADSNHDGTYDSTNYVWYSKANADKDKKNKATASDNMKSRSSQVVKLQGSIKAAKKVKTPSGTNLVVVLTSTDPKGDTIVDLGSVKQYDTMPRIGQDMSVEAAKFKTGDKTILLATRATRDGETQNIDRSGRQYTGTVSGMKTVKVRGNEHQMAKLTTDAGKKMLVDLGRRSSLDKKIKEGSKLTVTGPAVRVNDRLVLVARGMQSDGKTVDINRGAFK